MRFSKTFFVTITIGLCLIAFAAVTWLTRFFPLPVAGVAALFFVLIAAGFGRISGTAGEIFCRAFGRLAGNRFWLRALSLTFRRTIEMAPSTLEAPQMELAYESFRYDVVEASIHDAGFMGAPVEISASRFVEWKAMTGYADCFPSYYAASNHYLYHKQIQHLVSILLTPPEPSSVWMDVASSTSPFPEILRQLYKITVFRQDLSYPAGVNGLTVGSNATQSPVPGESIDRVSLHCSFEHFRGNSDSEFVKELARILRPGGMAGIIPIYVANRYQILSNPSYWPKYGIPSEEGASIVASQSYWEHHGRFYDWPNLKKRVVDPAIEHGLRVRFHKVRPPDTKSYPPFIILKLMKQTLSQPVR
jgi:SAM-dependent methyltransferase